MMEKLVNSELLEKIITMQQDEINGHVIYLRLADKEKDIENSKILRRIAAEEKKHYEIWKGYTGQELKPQKSEVWFFTLVASLFGLTFGIKLMEKGEDAAQAAYADILEQVPEAKEVMEEEEAHENELLDMLDEEALKYAGSVVLGLNDALVELTGALAGLTLAFQNTQLIALTGLITGISASFSMAASEYLSQKNEVAEEGEEGQDPIKSAIYTGIAYVITVIALILPYFVFSNYLVALSFTLVNAIVVIALFNYYISVAKDLSFRKRFLEMAVISLSVAAISFLVGFVVNQLFGVDL